MEIVVVFVFLLFAFSSASDDLSRSQVFTCLGQNVTFTAPSFLTNLSLQTEGVIVTWAKNDGETSHVLAVNASGRFLTAAGAGTGSSHIQYEGGKGTGLAYVRRGDLGVYTLRVHTPHLQPDLLHVQSHILTLSQQEELTLPDGHVHVDVRNDVIYDHSTGQWHVQLSCGRFLTGKEDVFVTWRTPSNEELNSTRTEGGQFVLHVPNPVQHGLYSCLLHTPLCQHDQPVAGKAGDVFVDNVAQRLRLLESELRALTAQCGTGECGQHSGQSPSQSRPGSSENQSEDMVRDGDYILAYRLTPRIGQSAYDTYVKVNHNDDDPLVRSRLPRGCLTVDGSLPCDRHYRSKVLDLWDKLNVQKVRLVVYENKTEVAYFEFNAVGATYINWLNGNRLTGSSYTDVLTEHKNYCSVHGVSTHRRFYINRNFGGCVRDAGWLVVTDSDEVCRPHWGPVPPYPVVGYIQGSTIKRWASSYVRYGDVMAIWVKMAPEGSEG